MMQFNNSVMNENSQKERLWVGVRQTCYVPQLQPDHSVPVPLKHLQGEVHPDGAPVVLGEHLLNVPLDDGRFPHSQVSDNQDFKQKLLLRGSNSKGRKDMYTGWKQCENNMHVN